MFVTTKATENKHTLTIEQKKKKKSPAKPAIYRLFDTNNVPAEDKHYPTYVWLSQKLFCNFGLSGIYNFD